MARARRHDTCLRTAAHRGFSIPSPQAVASSTESSGDVVDRPSLSAWFYVVRDDGGRRDHRRFCGVGGSWGGDANARPSSSNIGARDCDDVPNRAHAGGRARRRAVGEVHCADGRGAWQVRAVRGRSSGDDGSWRAREPNGCVRFSPHVELLTHHVASRGRHDGNWGATCDEVPNDRAR